MKLTRINLFIFMDFAQDIFQSDMDPKENILFLIDHFVFFGNWDLLISLEFSKLSEKFLIQVFSTSCWTNSLLLLWWELFSIINPIPLKRLETIVLNRIFFQAISDYLRFIHIQFIKTCFIFLIILLHRFLWHFSHQFSGNFFVLGLFVSLVMRKEVIQWVICSCWSFLQKHLTSLHIL